MEKSAEELYNERLLRLKMAFNLQEPDRVPMFIAADSWVAHYSGFTIQDIAYDYNKLFTAHEKVIQDFDCDCVWSAAGIWPAAVFDAVGGTQFMSMAASASPETPYQFPDVSHMEAEEYPELIADPYAFIIEKILPRRCSELAEPFPRNALALAKGALAFGQYLDRLGAAYQRWVQVYGVPILIGGLAPAPFDILADHFRGIRETLIDIKRRPEQVKAACEAILPLAVRFATTSYGGPSRGFSPVFIPSDTAMFLRPVDFEQFFWPTLRGLVEALAEMGLNSYLFVEGNWDPYVEYLAELPKGKVLVHLENTDIERAKVAVGKTVCLAGNVPCSLLGYGTEDEVIAYAKNLIDKVAPGGGFILSSDKILITPTDAKPKNLLALTKFVKEYGVYKK